ncbi:TfoX/Sxy family protein [Pseudoxanthobacter sp. M-2]|uniref:TfoX/Sxy family protein n=1 Tax=Pseudoxanthobacter sp. M-2 TaxID=3078754 RepID=UPI0038FBFEC1
MDPDWLHELFSPYGRVGIRRLFGGQSVYLDGLIVAFVADDVLYLKSDAETAPAFDAAGLAAFSYLAKGERRVLTSYRRAPEEALEDPDALRPWVMLAQSAAGRAAAKKAGGRRGKPAAKRSRSTLAP